MGRGKLKRFFKTRVFKREVGGTPLGNMIRKGLSTVSGGILGQGLLMKQEGETDAETKANDQRIIESVGGATAAAVVEENAKADIKKGAKMALLKKWGGIIVAGVIALGVIIWSVTKGKKGKRKKF